MKRMQEENSSTDCWNTWERAGIKIDGDGVQQWNAWAGTNKDSSVVAIYMLSCVQRWFPVYPFIHHGLRDHTLDS